MEESVLAGQLQGQRQLGRPRYKCVNITKISHWHVQGICCGMHQYVLLTLFSYTVNT